MKPFSISQKSGTASDLAPRCTRAKSSACLEPQRLSREVTL